VIVMWGSGTVAVRARVSTSECAQAAVRSIAVGGITCLIRIAVTVITYNAAVASPTGERYVNLGMNRGEVAGETAFHAHIRLKP
jgi:hypothetical protein